MKHDYRCDTCGHTFEAEVVKKQKRPRCPKCKSKKTKKLIPLPNIVFKGDGWGKDK
jgi:putative FmdB family regulatory protein